MPKKPKLIVNSEYKYYESSRERQQQQQHQERERQRREHQDSDGKPPPGLAQSQGSADRSKDLREFVMPPAGAKKTNTRSAGKVAGDAARSNPSKAGAAASGVDDARVRVGDSQDGVRVDAPVDEGLQDSHDVAHDGEQARQPGGAATAACGGGADAEGGGGGSPGSLEEQSMIVDEEHLKRFLNDAIGSGEFDDDMFDSSDLASCSIVQCSSKKKSSGYMPEPGFMDQRIGPLFKYEDFELAIIESLLRTRGELQGTDEDRVVSRKGAKKLQINAYPRFAITSYFSVRLTKFYNKTGPSGRLVRASLPVEFPASHAEGMACALARVARNAKRAPKASVRNFMKRTKNNVDDEGTRSVKIPRLKYGKE